MSQLLKKYVQLTQEELDLKIEEAKTELAEKGKTHLCEELIRYAGINSLIFAKIAFEKKILYPAILYKDATEQIRDAYIKMLDSEQIDEKLRVSNILVVLATIGDEKVCEAFKRWEAHPRKWREKLYVGPSDYAFVGNWYINDKGQREELTYSTCYGLEKRKKNDGEEVLVGEVAKNKCPNCQGNYFNLLTIDGRDERLAFLGIRGKISIKTCLSCIPWATDWIFCKYQENGESEVMPFESEDYCIYEYETLEEMREKYPLVLTKQSVSKNYCTKFEGSAIGGWPQWVDDAHYSVCPHCGKRMKHLAQLSSDDIESAGTIYVQICTHCHIAATCYQQS